MTNTEIYQLINSVKNELREDYNNKSNIDVNNHQANSALIDENSEALLDSADVIEENSEGVLDLADYIASLEERLEVIEKALNI